MEIYKNLTIKNVNDTKEYKNKSVSENNWIKWSA